MNRLAVFARWPVPERVKTRLAPALTEKLACDLHLAMLEDALSAALASRADERSLYWADAPGPTPTAGLATAAIRTEERFSRRTQRDGDLGARLVAAFDEMLAAPTDRAVVIGSDCPSLDAPIIDAAFAGLESRDLVLGPTRDGGYYLIGLSRPAPELFTDISWGTSAVLEETVRRARAAGHEPSLLTELEDLDTPEDAVRWIRSAALAESRPALRTDAALCAMGLIPPGLARARGAR